MMSVSTEMQITENNKEEKMSAKGRRGKLNIIDSWHTAMFPPFQVTCLLVIMTMTVLIMTMVMTYC